MSHEIIFGILYSKVILSVIFSALRGFFCMCDVPIVLYHKGLTYSIIRLGGCLAFDIQSRSRVLGMTKPQKHKTTDTQNSP
jgi:hypothetical protein